MTQPNLNSIDEKHYTNASKVVSLIKRILWANYSLNYYLHTGRLPK